MKRVLRYLALLCVAASAFSSNVNAAFPDRPVTIVIPFPAGGPSDIVTQAIHPRLAASLGQAVEINYAAGGTGAVGAARVKRATPDGYTIMLASIGVYATNPLLRELDYDPVQDFDLLSVAVRVPNILVVHPSVPVDNLAEFIAYLKKNPGKVAFATSGSGASDHLTTELFWQRTRTEGINAHFKGGGPALAEVLSGDTPAAVLNLNLVVPHVKAGNLKALAVTSASRWFALPNVPTFRESGIADLEVYSWQAIAAPKGLSAPVKSALHKGLMDSLHSAQVKQRLRDEGFEVVGSSPEEFDRFLRAEIALWKSVIDRAKLKVH